MAKKRMKYIKSNEQLEFDLNRPFEHDRNYQLGGRSFYFFDFDDNVAYLSTPIVIFHKENGEQKLLSSGEFAKNSKIIGKEGRYKDYYVDFNDEVGSFQFFRDKELNLFEKITRKKQSFLSDVEKAIRLNTKRWKAPSWNCFYHATFNKRPMSVITARGHHSETIKDGINIMVKEGHIPHMPNFLSLYPVSNPQTRKELGDTDLKASVPELKRKAIRGSVEKAIVKYGYSPYHRFGMSDDDPHNIELITEEMRNLKSDYPEMSFFVIETNDDSFVKREVKFTGIKSEFRSNCKNGQLNLF